METLKSLETANDQLREKKRESGSLSESVKFYKHRTDAYLTKIQLKEQVISELENVVEELSGAMQEDKVMMQN